MSHDTETRPSAPEPEILAAPEAQLLLSALFVAPIPHVAGATPDDLRRTVADGRRPAIFRGLTGHWPASREWHPDRLRERYGDRTVTALMDLPKSGVLFPTDQADYTRELSFADFLDAMRDTGRAGPCYLAYQRAADIFDPGDYDFTSLLPADGHPTDSRVWIGSEGTRSMLHSDLKDNLFCQVHGRKSVILMSWRDSRAAYPFPDNLVNSRVDLAHPDLDRFPRLASATFYQAVVEPGEILYIPRGWWHDIRAISPSISINHWFGPSQSTAEYLRLLARCGPRHWLATVRDFLRHGLLGRREKTTFFFSPPSTGRRLYDAVRRRGFSAENDPT